MVGDSFFFLQCPSFIFLFVLSACFVVRGCPTLADMQAIRITLLAAAIVATAVATSMDGFPVSTEPQEDFLIQSADPNVHQLTIPSSASGKLLGFNYGNVCGARKELKITRKGRSLPTAGSNLWMLFPLFSLVSFAAMAWRPWRFACVRCAVFRTGALGPTCARLIFPRVSNQRQKKEQATFKGRCLSCDSMVYLLFPPCSLRAPRRLLRLILTAP